MGEKVTRTVLRRTDEKGKNEMSESFTHTSATGKKYDLYGREVYRGDPIAKDSERFIVWDGANHSAMTGRTKHGSFRLALRQAAKLQREGRAVIITDRLIEGGA